MALLLATLTCPPLAAGDCESLLLATGFNETTALKQPDLCVEKMFKITPRKRISARIERSEGLLKPVKRRKRHQERHR
jgi:hypothetical protein